MARPRTEVEEAQLRELYTTQRMTVPRVARALGFSIGMIRSRLRELGLLNGYTPPNFKAEIPNEEIRRMYLDEHVSMEDIAKHFACSVGAIRKRIVKHGWLKKQIQLQKKFCRFKLTSEELYGEYITKGKSDEQIGREQGTCDTTVSIWRTKYGIKRECPSHKVVIPEEDLRRLYIDDRRTMVQIAELLGYNKSAVRANIARYGIGLDDAELASRKIDRGRANRKRSILAGGYRRIKIENHPAATHDGYIDEHRYVAEQAMGRYLQFEEQVHHINNEKLDNTDVNLAVIQGRKDHARIHKYMEKIAAYLLRLTKNRPDAMVFEHPCFWAGQWVTTVDLLASIKPLGETS